MLTLLQSFTPTLTGLLSDGSSRSVRAGKRFSPTLTLISRRSCVFRRAALTGRTRAARMAAALKAEQELQFASPRSYVAMDMDGANRAGVWTWDTGAGEARSGKEKALRAGVGALPETVAREGLDQGVRLVRCLEGVEGEVWSDGALVASRWWPEPPSPQEWSLFVRSARGTAASEPQVLTAGPPPVEEPRWLQGFPPLQPDLEAVATTASPTRVGSGLALAGLAAGALLGARLVVMSAEAAALEARIEAGGETKAQLAALRRSAQARSVEAATLANAGDERRVIDTLSVAIGALPTEQLRLRRASFSTDELTLEAFVLQPVDGPALVARLEQNASIKEAYVENADVNRLMVIRIKTLPPLAAVPSGGES